MDEELLAQQTQAYLQAVGTAWSTLEERVPLEEVHCLLEALPPRERKPLEPRDELAPDADRLPHAGIPPNLLPPQTPISLGEALKRHTHLVLLGEPGAGKTTTLRFLGLAFAQKDWAWAKLGLEERRVPVFLSLWAYAETLAQPGDAMMRALSEEVASRLQCPVGEARDLVDAWGDRGALLLLLDGLDEVPDEKRERVREQILACARSPLGRAARIVVTSRLAGFRTLGDSLAEFTLRPLEEGQAKEFLTRWLQALAPCPKEEAQQKADDLWPRLEGQPALARLLDNPLILRLVASHYVQKGEVARTRADLYRAYVDEAWERAVQRRGAPPGEKGAVLEALQALAWHLHGGGAGDEGAAQEAVQRYAKVAGNERAGALLALAREKAGLVAQVRGRLTFSHTTFQEYFVALRLQAAWQADRKATWRFLRPRLHLPAWREPLLLLAGLLPPEEARQFILQVRRAGSPYERRLRRDLFLAAALTGASGLEAPDLARAFLPDLQEALRDGSEEVRWAAARALSELGPAAAEAVPDLVRAALRDESEVVRLSAARALSALGAMAAEAIQDLRKALQKDDAQVRQSAVQTLQALGPLAADALPDLVQTALSDESLWLREAAAGALGALGPIAVEALPDLQTALQDRDWLRRWAAAIAMGGIRPLTSEAYSHLRAALQDGAKWVQVSARANLPTLLEALTSEDWWLRREAALLLGTTATAMAAGVPQLVQVALRDENRWVRKAAAKALGTLGPLAVEAVGVLYLALRGQDGDPEVREAAADALGALGPAASSALPALRAALRDTRWHVRHAAVKALQALGPAAASALPSLRIALQDRERWVRKATAEALGVLDPFSARSSLLDLVQTALQDQDWWVRETATETLMRWREQEVESFYTARERWRKDSFSIFEFHRLVVEEWNRYPHVRRVVAKTLGTPGRLIAFILPTSPLFLWDRWLPLRRVALNVVVKSLLLCKKLRRATARAWRVLLYLEDLLAAALLESEALAEELVEELVEESWEAMGPLLLPTVGTQLETAVQLGEACAEVAMSLEVGQRGLHEHLSVEVLAAMDRLDKLLLDEEGWVRWAAARAFQTLGPEASGVLPDLTQATLRDCIPWVREAAAEALEALGPAAAEAVPDLRAALRDGSEEVQVREAAAEALGKLGPAAVEAVPDLRAALRDRDFRVRRAAAWALEELGPLAAEAVPDLQAALRDEHWWVRGAAARALGGVGPAAAEAVPDLQAALRDRDFRVRRAAARALGRLGPAAAEAVPDLRAALRDGDEEVREAAARALGRLGPAAAEAVSDLRAALRDRDFWVRRAAAEALGSLGPAAVEVVPDLRAALRDRDFWVRWAAAETLAMIAPALRAQELEDLARRLARGRHYDALRDVLPHLEAHRAAKAAFDPLYPPPPPWWQRALAQSRRKFLNLPRLLIAAALDIVVEALSEALGLPLRNLPPGFLFLALVLILMLADFPKGQRGQGA